MAFLKFLIHLFLPFAEAYLEPSHNIENNEADTRGVLKRRPEGLKACNFIKKDSNTAVFVNIMKFLRTSNFAKYLQTTASENSSRLKSVNYFRKKLPP